MSQLQIQLDRIRRRWVLILVIGIVAAAGALGAAAVQGTTYTGRATLTIVSPDRAPEQDTPLAQGYADIFNQSSSQQELRNQAGVTADVTLNARIAAASPIVYVEATGRDAAQAQDAATKMAVALRDQINSGVGRGDTDQQRQQLTRDLAAAQARGDNGAISRIQGDIRDLDAGGTNELRDLQLNAGVAPNSTNAVRNAGAALAGGLLFGIALALALGRFENRIVTPNEVRDRLGLPVLAEVSGGKRRGDKGDARSALLHSLMGLTDAYGMPSPGTLAITGPKSTRATKSKVAIAIAGLRALQGQQTLLLQTDLDGEGTARELADQGGVAEFLAERTGARVDGKVFSNGRALLVGPPGRRRSDVFALYSKPHMQRLLQQGIALADLVIVDAPPAETVEGQIVCGTADRSLLVVEEGQTKSRDATGALESLQRVGSTALGVVLVRNPGQLDDGGFLAEGPWNPVALPPPPNKPAPAPAPATSAPAASSPAPSAAATPVVQYQPANRTQPITREKLDEARAAAAARESAANSAAANAANGSGHHTNGAGAANGATNGANATNGTNGTNGAANGAALGAAAGLAAAAGAAPSAPSAPAPGRGPGDGGPKTGDHGPSGAPDGRGAARPGGPSPAAGPGSGPSPSPSPRPQPSPGSGDKRPSPGPAAPSASSPKPAGPSGNGPSAKAAAGGAVAGAAAGAVAGNGKPGPSPGNPNAGGAANGTPNAGQAPSGPAAKAPSAPASPAGSSGPHPRPGGPAPTGAGQQASPSSPQGQKGPSSEQGAGTGPNVRRPTGGARPSPRPKPSPTGAAPAAPAAGSPAPTGGAGSAGPAAGSPSRAVSPAPAGSKRIGTARFVDGATPHSATGGPANGTPRPTAGGTNGGTGTKGTTGTNGGSTPGGAAPGGGDRLAAPTVTMRPEK